MTEHPTETVTVKASPELLAQMRDEWGPPVQVRATHSEDGWDFQFRTHDCAAGGPAPLVRSQP